MSEIYEDKEKCEAETGREYDRIKIERDESQQRFRTACGLRLNRSDSSGARVALASSSYAADLGLMSCNKTWPSTPEIGPLDVMLCSLLLH